MAEAGFDLSNWQAGAYAGGGGFSFGVAKASEGIGYKDPSYDRHIAAIRASGIIPGAFHFCREDLNPNDPEGEADWMIEVIQNPTGMILQCDAESSGGSAAWCRRFMQRLEARLGGYRGTFYSYLNWIQTRGLAGLPELGRYPLWFAWPSSAPMPTPVPWSSVAIQQWGLTAVPGVVGGVDADTFFGTHDELLTLTVGGTGGLDMATLDQIYDLVYRVNHEVGYGTFAGDPNDHDSVTPGGVADVLMQGIAAIAAHLGVDDQALAAIKSKLDGLATPTLDPVAFAAALATHPLTATLSDAERDAVAAHVVSSMASQLGKP